MANTTNDITTADRAYAALTNLAKSDVEEFWALALGPKKGLIRCRMIFRGTVNACLVHARDIFRFACAENATSILIAHNHPSGDTTPSFEDLRFTRQLITAGRILDIPVIDHLIVTESGYSSLRTEGWCEFQLEGSNSSSLLLPPEFH